MRRISPVLAAAVVGCVLVGGWYAFNSISGRLLRAHQQSVTKEIAAWGEAYSRISGPDDAGRSTEMVEYIRTYYVVGPGYRSDSPADEALEDQRQETIERIQTALREYDEWNNKSE